MKHFFLILTLFTVTLAHNAQAQTSTLPASSFQLVKTNLPEVKKVEFSFDEQNMGLNVDNLIAGQYRMQLVKTDSCGVRIYKSEKVVSNIDPMESAIVTVRNNFFSQCEMIYPAQYEVTVDTEKIQDNTGIVIHYQSKLLFNQLTLE